MFIAFEGLDGSGKTTQHQLLADRLRGLGRQVHATAEPTKGPIGALLRNILAGRIAASQEAIAGLFLADRLEHLNEPEQGLCARLAAGDLVLTDRYYFSSYAYHSLHLPMEWVIAANSLCAETLRPTVTIFVDVDPVVCFERLRSRSGQLEMYEVPEHLERVRANYLRAFDLLKDSENVAHIDGGGTPEQVHQAVWQSLADRGIVG
jgi:dTMP kinase